MDTRILLVEDEAPLRRSLESFLDRAGYTFDSCPTAREALVLAQALHPAVAIVEYHLPDASGSTLLKRLAQVAPDTVVVVISKYDFQAVAHEMARVDVHSYLKKPFDPVELEVALSSACARVHCGNGKLKRKRIVEC